MTHITRQQIVLHAVRWATNMLVEVTSNHVRAAFSTKVADKLRIALNDAEQAMRAEEGSQS
jgi:hypothetical protein